MSFCSSLEGGQITTSRSDSLKTSCLSATRSLASVGVFFLPLFAFCIRLSLSISDGCSIISTSWLPLYFVRPSLSLSFFTHCDGGSKEKSRRRLRNDSVSALPASAAKLEHCCNTVEKDYEASTIEKRGGITS